MQAQISLKFMVDNINLLILIIFVPNKIEALWISTFLPLDIHGTEFLFLKNIELNIFGT